MITRTENNGLFSIFSYDIKTPNPQDIIQQHKACQSIRKSISFSDFINPCQIDEFTSLATIQTIVKCIQNRMKTCCFYKLRQNWGIQKANICMDYANEFAKNEFAKQEQEDIQWQAKDHNDGFLALESRVTFRQKKQRVPKSFKEVNKKAFILTRQKQKLKADVERLKIEVQQVKIRQYKQISKKQVSLMGLMEELGDKNEQIEQLRQTVRQLASKVKVPQKGVLYMLQEDSDSLRRNILRLQHVNDRLNMDVAKGKNEIQFLQSQVHQYEIKCEEMQNEINELKQINFDLETNREAMQMMRKEAEIIGRRFNGKIQRVKKLEKRLSLVVKSKEFFNDQQNESKIDNKSEVETKNTYTQSSHSGLRRTHTLSIKEEPLQHKLQALFNFLFKISDEQYELQYPDAFEDEQIQLLKQHKELFIRNKIIHYIQTPNPQQGDASGFFNNSLDDILSQKDTATDNKDQQRILTLQKECQSMISKVYMLKERQLHIRSVILSLLKTLQIRTFKKEAEHILLLLCELFQYSESQRELIFAPKPRNIFNYI